VQNIFGTQKVVGLFSKLAPTFKSGGSAPQTPVFRRSCRYRAVPWVAAVQYNTCGKF